MKRTYVKPEILTESILEQTSLQCTVTEDYNFPENFVTGSLDLPIAPCIRNVRKDPNFYLQACDTVAPNGTQVCAITFS